MTTYAVIDDASHLIVNRIVLDEAADWHPPDGHTAIEETDGAMDIGGLYVDGVYTPPPSPELPPHLLNIGTG